jgi:parallel beta-helix repeat protein
MRNHVALTTLILGSLLLVPAGMMALSVSSFGVDDVATTVRIGECESFVLSQLTSHAPIWIDDNSDFGSLGFPGNGTWSNPYLIENLEIQGDGTDDGIFIGESVTAFYEILGCHIMDCTPYSGIRFYGGHGLIEDCQISNISIGVELGSILNVVSSVEVHSSRISDCSTALYAFRVDQLVLHDVDFQESADLGVLLDETSNVLIEDCEFEDSGIWAKDSSGLTLRGNVFWGRVIVENWNDAIVEQNTFYVDTYVGLEFRAKDTSIEDIIVRDCDFTASGQEGLGASGLRFSCILHRGSEALVQNCTFDTLKMDISGIDGLTVRNCRVNNGSMSISSSPSSEIHGNIVTYGGMTLLHDCISSQVYNNTLTDCMYYGIHVMENCTQLWIGDNSISGLRVDDYKGIYLRSDNVTVHGNLIENFDCGVHLRRDYCIVANNTVFNNNMGIQIAEDASFNELYYNIIYGNDQNALDDGSQNIWDDGVELGNYWGDLAAPGEYLIPGAAGSVDHYAQPYGPGLPLPTIILVAGVIGVVAVVAVVVKLRR